MTQEVLSERADIAPSYLARIETGSRHPTLDVIGRLAEALDLSLARLLGEGEQRHIDADERLGKTARVIAQIIPELSDADLELVAKLVARLHRG